MASLTYLQDEMEMPSLDQIKVAFEKFDKNSKRKYFILYQMGISFYSCLNFFFLF
jgi:hypothetical protein